MKYNVGNKLMEIRDKRKLNQAEMADILGMSASSYARIERNERNPDMEEIVRFSEKLNIPIYEFLPESFSIHNNHNGGQAGIIFGTFNYYTDKNEAFQSIETENKLLKQENEHLKEKCKLLERMLEVR